MTAAYVSPLPKKSVTFRGPLGFESRCIKEKEQVCNLFFFFGAEGGIRTHVGVNPNGFQDRLVMTTSIPLRLSLNNINTTVLICQEDF